MNDQTMSLSTVAVVNLIKRLVYRILGADDETEKTLIQDKQLAPVCQQLKKATDFNITIPEGQQVAGICLGMGVNLNAPITLKTVHSGKPISSTAALIKQIIDLGVYISNADDTTKKKVQKQQLTPLCQKLNQAVDFDIRTPEGQRVAGIGLSMGVNLYPYINPSNPTPVRT